METSPVSPPPHARADPVSARCPRHSLGHQHIEEVCLQVRVLSPSLVPVPRSPGSPQPAHIPGTSCCCVPTHTTHRNGNSNLLPPWTVQCPQRLDKPELIQEHGGSPRGRPGGEVSTPQRAGEGGAEATPWTPPQHMGSNGRRPRSDIRYATASKPLTEIFMEIFVGTESYLAYGREAGEFLRNSKQRW